jgi:hypothetical protein
MAWNASGLYIKMSKLGLTIRKYPNGNDPAKITTNKGKHRTCSQCKKTKHVYRFHSKNIRDHQGKVVRYRLQRMCGDCRNDSQLRRYCRDPHAFVSRRFQTLKQKSSHHQKGRRRCYMNLKQYMNAWKEQYNKTGLKCPLSGVTMTHQWKQKDMSSNISVDRINNDKDYELGNIQFVCAQANRMKGDLSQDQLKFWTRNIANER